MDPPARTHSGSDPATVRADLEPLVDFRNEGMPLDVLDGLIERRLVPHLVRYDHPGFQSMFNTVPEEAAQRAASLALAYNQGVTNWQVSPGGAMLEELCGESLCRLFGLGPDAAATFHLAGTYANLQGVYLALHRHAERQGFDFACRGIAGFTAPSRLALALPLDTHFSLRHAVRLLGLGEDCLVPLDVDAERRLDVSELRRRLAELRGERDVFCVVANAGTTPTGAVDPLRPVAEICAEVGAWLHVDAAYGFAYRLVPERRHLFDGIELADSICWDPHKQFGVPIPSSLLFVRRRQDFDRAAVHSSYFNRPDSVRPNPGLRSPPSTRPMAALPLCATLLHLGLAEIVERLRAPLLAIERLAEHLTAQKDFEVCHRPDLGVLCFRATPAGCPPEKINDLQERIVERIAVTGERLIAITRLGDKTALRVVAVSPMVTEEALRETVQVVRRVASELVPRLI